MRNTMSKQCSNEEEPLIHLLQSVCQAGKIMEIGLMEHVRHLYLGQQD